MSEQGKSSSSMSAQRNDLSRRVATYIVASAAGGTRVGPFTVHFDNHTANVWRNYAVPDIGATPSRADIAALLAVFADRDRTPRLEYVPAASPDVEPALVAAGFAAEFRSPVFGCLRGEASDLLPPEGVTLALVTTDADLLDAVRVQHAAYEEPAPAGPKDVARLAALNGRGGIVVLARDAATGEPIGSGLCEQPTDGVSELAAIGVTEPYRRRGIGSAMTAFLARAMHARGAELIWLEREPHVKDRMYELAGFTRGAEKLWISRPDG
jgi:ribosomal protein S18 acetylase RimI-like enzyme